jgi:integral membrane sensor domain MASE1
MDFLILVIAYFIGCFIGAIAAHFLYMWIEKRFIR